MSIDGIWTSEILGLFGWESTGIMVLEKGRVIDGGNNHFSVGSYKVTGKNIRISLSVEYHGKPRTLFGASDKKLTIKIKGEIRDGIIEGTASPGNSDQEIASRLTRRADIPSAS